MYFRTFYIFTNGLLIQYRFSWRRRWIGEGDLPDSSLWNKDMLWLELNLSLLQHLFWGKHADTGMKWKQCGGKKTPSVDIYRTAKEQKWAFRVRKKYLLILICKGCRCIWEGTVGKNSAQGLSESNLDRINPQNMGEKQIGVKMYKVFYMLRDLMYYFIKVGSNFAVPPNECPFFSPSKAGCHS